MLSWKQNALGLSSKKVRWDFKVLSIRRHDLSYSGQLKMMCSRVVLSQGQFLGLSGKKRCRYSPVGAWLVIIRVARARRDGEFSSQAPPIDDYN